MASTPLSSATFSAGPFTADMSAKESAVAPEPMDSTSMTPTNFVLWLNGVIDVLNDTPPNQVQWDIMREKIAGQVGAIVSARIRAAAQPTNYSGEVPSPPSASILAAKYHAQVQSQ
jgi:hypothetical protein